MREVILSTALAASSFTSFCQDSPRDVIAAEIPKKETGWEGDHLTGTWGGLRTQLVERGVHFHAGYIGEVLGSVSGGERRGVTYEGLLELGLELQTGKLGLWEGGKLYVSSLYPHGRGITEKYVGDLLGLSNIEGHDSFRLYELWYEQQFWGGRLSLRFGQMTADEEFAYTEPGSYFLNSGFGWPAFISANTMNTGPAFYVAAPGARLRYDATESLFVQAAIFDGDSFDNPEGDPRVNASGTRIHVSGSQGLFGIAEAGFRWNQAEGANGLTGEYKVGAWVHTGDFPSNFEDENRQPFVMTGGEPRDHASNYGVYIAAQQMLWREEEDQGVYAFARGGISPRDRSLFEAVVEGGFTYKGLFPSRGEDVTGIGALHARLSRDIRRAERLDRAVNGTRYDAFSDHETVLEAFYFFQLAKWWTVQPDVQWIFNPGGNKAGSDAVVVGVRTSIVF